MVFLRYQVDATGVVHVAGDDPGPGPKQDVQVADINTHRRRHRRRMAGCTGIHLRRVPIRSRPTLTSGTFKNMQREYVNVRRREGNGVVFGEGHRHP